MLFLSLILSTSFQLHTFSLTPKKFDARSTMLLLLTHFTGIIPDLLSQPGVEILEIFLTGDLIYLLKSVSP